MKKLVKRYFVIWVFYTIDCSFPKSKCQKIYMYAHCMGGISGLIEVFYDGFFKTFVEQLWDFGGAMI